MSEPLVLVDSSAWVAHLTDQPSDIASEIADILLPARRVAINAVIRIEVLTGALNETQYVELEERFAGLRALELTASVWRLAERTRFSLRKHGLLVSVPDVVIASCAMAYDCELLHADRHFNLIAKHAPLKTYTPTRVRRVW
jgi:hypothetical protein